MQQLFHLPSALFIDWVHSAVLFGCSLLVFVFIRHALFRGLDKYESKRASHSTILRTALRLPTMLWCIAGSISITLEYASIPGSGAKWASSAIVVVLVVSMCAVTSSLLVRLVSNAALDRGLSFGLSGVARALVHVFTLLIGATFVLRYFNLNITPLLTALGVGGLALALALRDTLANFFAGIHIILEAPISMGDFIRLSSGEEGTVTDIGWRTTRVLTGNNNIIVIPNEKITSSILTNYNLPSQKVVFDLTILLAHDANVSRASEIAIEEALNEEKVIKSFQPLIVFDPGVTPTHLQFKLVMQGAQRLDQGLIQSNIRLRLLERYRKEGIDLPIQGKLPASPE